MLFKSIGCEHSNQQKIKGMGNTKIAIKIFFNLRKWKTDIKQRHRFWPFYIIWNNSYKNYFQNKNISVPNNKKKRRLFFIFYYFLTLSNNILSIAKAWGHLNKQNEATRQKLLHRQELFINISHQTWWL